MAGEKVLDAIAGEIAMPIMVDSGFVMNRSVHAERVPLAAKRPDQSKPDLLPVDFVDGSSSSIDSKEEGGDLVLSGSVNNNNQPERSTTTTEP